MKIGFRVPSLRKRIAARTSLKRVIRHNLGFKVPRGFGWLTNPRRAAYNRVYNQTSKGCLVVVTALLCAAGSVAFLACGQAAPPTARGQDTSGVPASPAPHTPRISYQIVKQWAIPNGGYGRVIVVDPAQRSEAGLLAVAEQLRRDTKNDRNAFAFIYDQRDAAMLRDAALEERLSKADMKQHDDHMIGTYIRNANTGFHAVTIALQGVNGPMRDVPLR